MKCSMRNIMAIRYQAKEIEKLMNDDSTSYSMKRALVLLCATAIMIVCDDIVDSNKKETSEMTNEEWLRQASTEDVAKWLSKISKFFHECGKRDVYPKTMYEEDWETWLKEIRNDL